MVLISNSRLFIYRGNVQQKLERESQIQIKLKAGVLIGHAESRT